MPKAEKKTKLCWNCEGNVARDAVNCKYCGVYLHQNEEEEREFEEESQERELDEIEDAALENPTFKRTSFKEEPIAIPLSPYASQDNPQKEESHLQTSPRVAQMSVPHTPPSWQALFFPLLFLSSASFLPFCISSFLFFLMLAF